jgi:tetratricopeptide (TPR) repeat protein
VLHALVLGPKQDAKTLSAIVEKTNGRVVTVSLGSDMEKSVEQAVVELQRPVGASFEFYDEGAEWIFPKSFRDVGPGDEMVLFSRVKDGAAAKPGVIQRNALGNVVKDQPLTAPPREAPAFAPLFEREACAAYLNHLEKLEQETVDQAKIAELRKQRIDVSVKHRVLCPLTSLLVLETEQDYARFGIDRKALADVMVVGNKGIELRHRTAEDQPVVQVARPRERAGAARRELAEETEAAANKPAETAKEESETLAISGAVNFAQSDDARDDSGGGGQSGDLEVVRSDRAATTTTDFSAPSIQAPSTPAPLGETRVAEPAPVATPPVMPPLRRPEQQQTQETARPVVQQPGWTAQYQAVPKDDELNALRAQVAAAPRERRLRNTYANALLKKQDWDGLQALAFEWLPFDSENPQVYEFLGKSATGLKDLKTALRAFTSIAEIAPNRAALLARAGWLLLIADQHEMAAQMFREALKNRDDDPNIYRGLALACWLKGDFVGTADTLEGALKQKFNERYGDARRVLSEELGYVYRAWLKAVQTQADDTHARVSKRAESVGVKLKRVDAIRVTLGWETDANDVDLHVVDPAGEECFYSHKNNKSGLELYSDQTQGLGPEVIRCSKAQTGVYHVGVNYFAAGPMGVSRGVVVILQPDAEGLVERPQIVPFCLAEGGADMRHLAAVVVP